MSNLIGLTLDCSRNLCGQDARAPGEDIFRFGKEKVFMIE